MKVIKGLVLLCLMVLAGCQSEEETSQFLLPYLDRFHRQYPAIHIQIVSGRSH